MTATTETEQTEQPRRGPGDKRTFDDIEVVEAGGDDVGSRCCVCGDDLQTGDKIFYVQAYPHSEGVMARAVAPCHFHCAVMNDDVDFAPTEKQIAEAVRESWDDFVRVRGDEAEGDGAPAVLAALRAEAESLLGRGQRLDLPDEDSQLLGVLERAEALIAYGYGDHGETPIFTAKIAGNLRRIMGDG